MTDVARAALLLAALAAWGGGSRRVAVALLVETVGMLGATLLPWPRAALACYLLAPAASGWLALRVATGRGWPALLAWAGAALAVGLAPHPRAWWHVAPVLAHLGSVVVQLGAVASMRRPFGHGGASVVVLLAGDVALALALPSPDATWWTARAQSVIVAVAIAWLHFRA